MIFRNYEELGGMRNPQCHVRREMTGGGAARWRKIHVAVSRTRTGNGTWRHVWRDPYRGTALYLSLVGPREFERDKNGKAWRPALKPIYSRNGTRRRMLIRSVTWGPRWIVTVPLEWTCVIRKGLGLVRSSSLSGFVARRSTRSLTA